MEEGDGVVVTLQKARENQKGVKQKRELVMDENSVALYFGSQKQTKVTSPNNEKNTSLFILQQLFKRYL